MVKKLDRELVNKILYRQKWEFRPCPFCGRSDIGVSQQIMDVFMNGPDMPCIAFSKIWARCNYCGAHGSEKVCDIVFPQEAVAVAVEGWNHREAAVD